MTDPIDNPVQRSASENHAITTASSPWTRWGMGYLFPIALFGYSLYSLHRGSITLPGKRRELTIYGDDVAFLAAAYVALAVFLHVHCVWDLHERLWHHPSRLRAFAFLVFLACLVIAFYRRIGFGL